MEKFWFIYQNEIVKGPYSTQEVNERISNAGWSAQSTLIWWRGQKTWISVELWMGHLPEILQSLKKRPEQTTWYAEQDGQQFGPMSQKEAVGFLKKRRSLDKVHLWREGMDRWTSLFEIEDIVEELGLTRRVMPRAPIVARATLNRGNKILETQVLELSAGGFGIKEGPGFSAGEPVLVNIESPLLVSPVRSHAHIAYVKDSGFTGLKFDNLHIESKSTIIDYVRQFHEKTQPKSAGRQAA